MQQYIAILLLIAPGFIARRVHEDLTWSKYIKSEFEKTVLALIYSVPISVLNFLIIYLHNSNTLIASITTKFNNTLFIFKYTILTLFNTMLFAYLWSKIHPAITIKIINAYRKYKNLNQYDQRSNVWDAFINDGDKFKAIEIIKGGKSVGKGFIEKWNFQGDDEKEVYLEKEKIFDIFPKAFEDVKGTYYNIDKDLIIKKYNLSKLYSILEEKESNKN